MTQGTAAAPVASRPGPPGWLEALVYAGFALVTIAPAMGGADRLPGDGVDLYGTVWFYWWIADCLAHLRDPSFTDLFFHPYGKDIFAHTGNNFVDAVASLPLQWLIGTPGYYKWWVAVLIVGNAAAFRVLARAEISDPWAAFAATTLWIANPYVIFELQCGRPTQAFLWFLPLALWALLRVDRSVAMALACGVLAALVGWSYWYYGYFFAFAAAWLVAVEGVRRWRDPAHGDLRRYARNVAIATATAAILVAPAVMAMAARASAGELPGVGEANRALLAPPDTVGTGLPSLHGYVIWEPTGPRYLQHPAWFAGLIAWLALGRNRLRWVGVTVIGLVVATGAQVEVAGHQVPMAHYLLLYNGLPFFDRLWFPYRALVLVFLALSLGLGDVIARAREAAAGRWGEARGRAAAAGLAMAFFGTTLATERLDLVWPLVARDVPLPRPYAWMAAQGGGIIDLPRGISQNYIVHQPRHGLPMFGGMGENVSLFWPDGYRLRTRNPLVAALTRAGRDPSADPPEVRPEDRERIRQEGFRWVVLHRELVDSEFNPFAATLREQGRLDEAPFLVQARVTDLLGPPVAVDGPMVVWALDEVVSPPDAIVPTPEGLTERTWSRPEPAPFEARLYELGRLR